MGLTTRDLYGSEIIAQVGLPGGVTYYVDGEALCLRPLTSEGKSEFLCSNRAGKGTDHVGTGRCRWHGGNAGRHPKHGRYADVAKMKTAMRMEELAEDEAEMMSLVPELILQRTLLEEGLIRYERSGSTQDLAFVRHMVGDVIATVQKISSIQSQQALTLATARFLMAKGMEVAAKFIPKEQMDIFVSSWKAEVMGHIAVIEAAKE